MADLLAGQENKKIAIFKGQQLIGEVVSIGQSEVLLDLGSKSEGVLSQKDLLYSANKDLKLGDKIEVFVVSSENESGQVVVGLQRDFGKKVQNLDKWNKFKSFKESKNKISGRVIEANKGGLIIESSRMRGFLPLSQLTLHKAANPDSLVGQELNLRVIEVEPNTNRLIFCEAFEPSKDIKEKFDNIKQGDVIKGTILSILPFGIFINIEGGLEGLVHISELSWERKDEPLKDFKEGQEIESIVLSKDLELFRVNLSLKGLLKDPFDNIAKKYSNDDVVRGVVIKVTENAVIISLDNNIEGIIPSISIKPGATYNQGEVVTVLIDKIDQEKRKIYLAPFITSTAGLIYK